MCHLPKQQENITNSRWRKREEKKNLAIKKMINLCPSQQKK